MTKDFNGLGTSGAALFVAGVEALLRSKAFNTDNQVSFMPAQTIKTIILNNVDIEQNLSTRCVSGERLNAFKIHSTFFGNCDGIISSPFIISTSSHIKNLILIRGIENKYFKLVNNVSITPPVYQERKSFAGVLDGQGTQ